MKLQFSDTATPEAAPRSIDVRRSEGGIDVALEGRTVRVEGGYLSPGVLQLRIDGRLVRVVTASSGETRYVARGPHRFQLQRIDARASRRARHDGHGGGELTATMPGQVLKVLAAEGDRVMKGQPLVIIEAMKMEHEIRATQAGTIRRVACVVGAMVSPGVALVELEPDPAE